MTAKEYLKQLRCYEIKINQLSEEVKNLKILAVGGGSLSMDPNKVQTSIPGDKMSEKVSKYVDMENELLELQVEYQALRMEIINEIHQLNDSRYIQILYLKYLKNLRLEQIACEMHKSNGDAYSFDHINTLHGEALQEFDKKILNPIETPSFS